VFDSDGSYVRAFTGGGMNGPNCIAFDSSGNIFVASAITANVIKFDTSEELVTTFTGGGLSSPMGIARDNNDVLYVAGGGSNNIVKFDVDGNYLGEIRHPDLTGPQGVAFDDQGHLFSSSFYQDNVVEFDINGGYVRTITEGGLDIPRSIAFVPTSLSVGLVGDFDDSGTLDAADIDILSGRVHAATYDAAFDLTNDNMLNDADRLMWIEELAGTLVGDADLNRNVEFADFLALAQRFNAAGGWADGDFDGNGEVQFGDFLALSQNFGLSSSMEMAASVPEPSCPSVVSMLVLAGTYLQRRRRRH
jgi:hypothetical protein